MYDRNLQSLSPAQCYRAATVDSNNAIFLISEYEEQRLAASVVGFSNSGPGRIRTKVPYQTSPVLFYLCVI